VAVLEAGLRLAGYGYVTRAIVRYRSDDFDKYCDNIRFSWRFFPRSIAREFEPFTFETSKGKKTCRIFVAGASAAQGIPDGSYSFARMLGIMLAGRYPDIDFEVINTAVTAVNSHVVLPIVRDCARHEPDIFIIYMGNNEVVGPYGPGTVFGGFSPSLRLIRWGIALKATRTGQLLADIAARLSPRQQAIRSWGGMEMFLEKRIRASDDRLDEVYAHFEQNLIDIRRAARKAGAEIIFCTVGVNLKDCAPFASLHRADLSEDEKLNWQKIYDGGVLLEEQARYEEAIEKYLSAAAIDDARADLHFRMATCYWNMERFDEAHAACRRACQLDALRFRADETINGLIRRVSMDRRADGVYLVDFARILEQASEHGIASQQHFYEHVHLNFSGNYLLAKALAGCIEEILGSRIRPGQTGGRPLPDESECARRLAYTDWDRYRLTEKVLKDYIMRPPFTNQLYHDRHVASLRAQLDRMKAYIEHPSLEASAAAYRRAIRQSPLDWSLHYKFGRLFTEELKDYRAAAAEFGLVQRNVPHFHRGYTAMGQVLEADMNVGAAIGQYLRAIRLNPASVEAHYHLAGAYRRLRQYDKAADHYRRAISLRPNYVSAYNKLAEMLNQQGQVDEAIEVCRRGIAVAADNALLHGNLGILLSRKGRNAEATKQLQIALELDPNSPEIRRVMTIIGNRRN